MQRRTFLSSLAGAGLVAALPAAFWRDAAEARAGTGPYGPLGPPDANGIQLPPGFRSRVIGVTGRKVAGTDHIWHAAPDGGGCVGTGDGGWVYVSNAELDRGRGGVSAIRFDSSGDISDSYTILSGTNRNCAGGVTPWRTWLSCEEAGAGGQVWECDPLRAGQGTARPALGRFNHEAAAVDPRTGDVYLTEDDPDGRWYRFVPDTPGDLSAGDLFAASIAADGVVRWVPTSPDHPDRQVTTTAFAGGEGIHVGDREGDPVVYFVTKHDRRVWEYDLTTSQLSVAYDCDATPQGSLDAVDNVVVHGPTGDVFVAEDGGNMELGVMSGPPQARTTGPMLRIVGHDGSEVAGPAFSPDGTRLYVSSQRGADGATGMTYEITGPFTGGRSAGELPAPACRISLGSC